MKLSDFFKDKIIFILAQSFMVFFIGLSFNVMKISPQATMLICVTIVLITLTVLLLEYLKKNTFYRDLYRTLDGMDKKQYISNMLGTPDFGEGRILTDVLKQTTKAMNDEIASYQILQEEYREYIETWIHEVKIPIAGIGLICENNKNEITKSILKETTRIDSFVEQALFYARSTNLEKDYSIREIELESFIKVVVKKHAGQLIACRTELELDNLQHTVFSDPKWLDFILGQLISNSIKYRKETLALAFSAQETDLKVILRIADNGTGIPKKDLTRVFEKGFTGENGRKFAKSTGIGLYLCKRLCDKMHLGLEVSSQENEGTVVRIIFPKDTQLISPPTPC